MSFEAGFDTSAQLMESGIPEEIMRHEMNGDPVNVEEVCPFKTISLCLCSRSSG